MLRNPETYSKSSLEDATIQGGGTISGANNLIQIIISTIDPDGWQVNGGTYVIEYWANGMKTLHGFSSPGFPNCFLMGLSQNGLSVNLTSVLDDQAQHIGYIIKQVMERGARYSQPTAEAEAAARRDE